MGAVLRSAVAAALMSSVLAVAPAMAVPASAGAGGGADFDGDGYADLVVGAPFEAVGGISSAGNVTVVPGGPNGPSAGRATTIRQGLRAPGSPEEHDWFGQAVAGADFDGDGFDDLAVGAPGEAVGDLAFAGNVTVSYGSAGGLTGARTQVLRQGLAGVGGVPEIDDGFGSSLAVGDVNGDGYDDLVVGAPRESVGNAWVAGNASLVFGSATGLAGGRGTVTIRQGLNGLPGVAESDDQFGSAVAVADLDADGFADVAVGAPGEAVGDVYGAGNVTIVPGTATGVALRRGRPHNAGTTDCDCLQSFGAFGQALAGGGDVNGDGFEDLAVGAPTSSRGQIYDGYVTVLFGTGGRIDPTVTVDQATAGQAREFDDEFGSTVAIGDVTGDGYDELVVGTPREDVGSSTDAGLVIVIRGVGAEFPGPARVYHQGTLGGSLEAHDTFGWDLAVGDYDGDGTGDLAVGVPNEDVGDVVDAGNVTVGTGSPTGVGGPVRSYNQSTVGGAVEERDLFGATLG